MPSDKNEAKRIIKRFLNFFYQKSEIDRILGSDTKKDAQISQTPRFQTPLTEPKQKESEEDVASFSGVIKWSQVFLTVRSDTYFEVRYPGGVKNLSKDIANFTPMVWGLLLIFAKQYGELKPENLDAVKNNVSRLRKALKRLFPSAKGDPIPYKRSGYETAFAIRLGEHAE